MFTWIESMTRDIRNKIVVVTGAASGIGLEVSDQYLDEGAKLVILLDINEKTGAEAEKKLTDKYGEHKDVFIKCNVVTDLEEVSNSIFEKYKNVDVLVNSAGIVDETSVQKIMTINAIATMEWTMKFWDHMSRDNGGKGGTIINLSSIFGFRSCQYGPYYAASKHAVLGFSKSIGHRENYEKSGVRVIAMCPGFTATNLGASGRFLRCLDTFEEYLTHAAHQNVDVVGRAAVEIFKMADSGSAWVIEGGQLSQYISSIE